MKDFYDVWVLSKTYDFSNERLAQAIGATFERRKTAILETFPDVFTLEFSRDEGKLRQWSAFVPRDRPSELASTISGLMKLLKSDRTIRNEPKF